MTYRERRERKAERLRGWAEKREQAAAAVFKAGEPFRGDIAFNTQPGAFPFRTRLIAREDRAYQSLKKARAMDSRADSIEAQAAAAIYSDDPDAVQALEAKIAKLEAERDRLKRYNASCRKGARDLSILDDEQREQLAVTLRVQAYAVGSQGQCPAYVSANLSGNIARLRKRLEGLRPKEQAC